MISVMSLNLSSPFRKVVALLSLSAAVYLCLSISVSVCLSSLSVSPSLPLSLPLSLSLSLSLSFGRVLPFATLCRGMIWKLSKCILLGLLCECPSYSNPWDGFPKLPIDFHIVLGSLGPYRIHCFDKRPQPHTPTPKTLKPQPLPLNPNPLTLNSKR